MTTEPQAVTMTVAMVKGICNNPICGHDVYFTNVSTTYTGTCKNPACGKVYTATISITAP